MISLLTKYNDIYFVIIAHQKLKDKGKYKDFADLYSQNNDNNGSSFDNLVDKLDSYSSIDEAGKALSASKASKEKASNLLNSSSFSKKTEQIESIVSSLPTDADLNTTTSQKLGQTFAGIGQSITAFASTTVGQVAIAAAAITGLGVVINALEGPSYDELQQQASASMVDFTSAQSESDTVTQNLTDINSRIAEINSHPLALTDQQELSALQAQKKELEQTATLKENLAKAKQDKAALDASKAMEAKSSKNASVDAESGSLMKKFSNSAFIQSDNAFWTGLRSVTGFGSYKNVLEQTDQQAITSDIQTLNKLKAEREKLKEEIATQEDGPTSAQKKKSDSFTDNIASLESDLAEKQGNVSSSLSAMMDDKGNILAGYETQAMLLKDSLNELAHYDTFGMTDQQKQTNSISEFFGRSSTAEMNERFTKLAESNKLSVGTLESLGLSEDSFGGASLQNVVKYFDDIASSAKKAAEAANEVDGSIEGIDAAAQSENAGDDFVKMKGYLDQSQKLYKQGLTGTDDFKTIEKMITQGTGKSYQEAYDQLQNYYTTDTNPDSEFFGQLTRDGIQNFAADFKELKGTFKTTGDAASEMGLSTQMFEALMGRTEDYEGFEDIQATFKNMASSSQQLNEAKTNLEGLKTIYDNMQEGKEKEQLGLDIDKWENDISNAENDLSSLPEEVVTQLKFEYDRQQLEELNKQNKKNVENGLSDEDTLSTQAETISNNDQITEDIMAEKGITEEDTTKNSDLSDKLNELKDKSEELKNGDLNDSEKIQAQKEKIELQEEYNELLEEWDGKSVTADVEADTEAVTDIFSAISDEEDRQVMIDFFPNTEDATAALDEYNELSLSPKFVELSAEDKATAVMVSLQEEELGDKFCSMNAEDRVTGITNMVNDLSMNDKWSTLSAEDRATAIIEYYNGLTPEQKTAVFTATGLEDTTSKAGAVDAAIRGIDSTHSTAISTSGSEFAIMQAQFVANAINGIPSFRSCIVSVTPSSTGLFVPPLPGLSGVGGADGTAHSLGTASPSYAGGNWGLPQSGKALINELGSEIIVRDGSWFIMNNGYPTLANLHSGDIIFNHKQSKDILNNGYVTGSHARMIGSSLASGTVSGLTKGRAFASGSGDEFKETFDHIEIWIKRMESALDQLTDSIDGYSYNLSKQNSVADTAMNAIRGNISTLERSYQTYLDKANSVGLEENWANVVKNGEIKLSEITDKDLKERIDDYEEYYENALDTQQKIADLQKDLLDLAVQKLDNIDNYFSNRFDYNENFGYETSISELKEALDKYTNELGTQVDSGIIKEFSDEWYEAQEQIADYWQDILEATWNKYEVIIDNLDRIGDNLEDSVSLKEAKDLPVTEDDYQKQISNNNALVQKYYELRQAKVQEQGKYDLNSDLYKDLEKDIASLDSKIYGTLEDNEKLKDSIWEVRFTNPFEKLIDGLDETMDSADNLRDLMDEDSFLDKNGGLTANGIANLALLNQSLIAAKQKTADYTAGLQKLDEAYKSGILSLSEYEESQADFLKEIQDSVGDVEDYKQEIIDLYKEQLEAETEAQQDYYDKRKDSLSLDKEYYEFSKKVNSQSKSVNQIKAQIAALEGVNNDASRAELKRLQAELAEQENDLAETKRDHAYDMQKQGYDTLSDGLDTALEDTLYEITMNAGKQEQVITEMLNHIVGNYQTAYETIQGIISGTGFTGNEGFNNNLAGLGTQQGAGSQASAGSAGQSAVKPGNSITGTNTGSINQNPGNDQILNELQQTPDISSRKVAEIKLSTSSITLQEGKSANIAATIRPTDAKNKTLNWSSSNPSIASVSNGSIHAKKAGQATILCTAADGSGITVPVSVTVTPPPAPAPTLPPQTSTPHEGIPFREKQDSYPKHLLNQNSSIVDRLKYNNFDSSMDACRDLYAYWGGSGFYSGTAAQNSWLLSKMQSAGYSRGTKSVTDDGADFVHEGEIIIRRSDNGLLFPLKRGDGVIPSGLSDNLWKLAENAPGILNGTALNLNTGAPFIIGTMNHTLTSEIKIGNLLNVEGDVASDDILAQLKAALPYCAKELAQQVSREFAKDSNKIR